jgi:hypothetical protein
MTDKTLFESIMVMPNEDLQKYWLALSRANRYPITIGDDVVFNKENKGGEK